MSIEPRAPGQGTEYVPVVPATSTLTSSWGPSSWTTKTTIETITKTPCGCSTTVPPPVVIVTSSKSSTPTPLPIHGHNEGGLASGVIGGIVIGAFFGFLLLVLLCIFCVRAYRKGRYIDYDDESPPPRRRRRHLVPVDPYPNRPDANLTFVGGGNRRETRVVITKSQRYFVRPKPDWERDTRTVRTTRETRREKIIIVDD